MKNIKYISSSRQDYLLAPDELRRYTNAILAWFVLIEAASIFLLSPIFFYGESFLGLTKLIFVGKSSLVDMPVYCIKAGLLAVFSCCPAWWTTNKLTPAISRQVITAGNFVDDTKQAVTNLAKEFQARASGSIPLLRAGEPDGQGRALKKPLLLPDSVLQLSTIVRGQAGSGKTVFTDRLIKEKINAKQKLVLHNIKGDEFKKLSGHCHFYLIEPWNTKAGYAINFLALLNRDREEDRNAYIYSFVKSFMGKAKLDPFFDPAAIEVLFAVIKKVVEDNRKAQGTIGLQSIVDLWISFNANTESKELDLTDSKALQKAMNGKIESLEKIKAVLLENNPTQADLIDSQNAKTSLCILATCTKTIKKFEVLAKFWGNREQGKSLDLVQWLANKKDRPVLLLSNSNLYVAEAEAYISAVINLLTMFVINPEYEPVSEVNFILDEFPQLSSIDLKQFMKLPDVGRGKQVRTTVVLQRTSQIKEVFDVSPESFAAAFQNKVWAGMAADDFDLFTREAGKQEVRFYKNSNSHNAQGTSTTMHTETKIVDAVNASDMQKELGPVEINGKFQGVRMFLNFAQIKRLPVLLFPPVVFEKKCPVQRVKSKASAGLHTPSGSTTAEDPTEPPTPQLETETFTATVLDGQALQPAPTAEPANPELTSLAGQLLPEPVCAAMELAELLEEIAAPTENTTVVHIDSKNEQIKALLAKNKKEVQR